MQISDESLKEYQRIYKEGHGEELTLEEAREAAGRLLALYKIIMRPLPGEKPNRQTPSEEQAQREP